MKQFFLSLCLICLILLESQGLADNPKLVRDFERLSAEETGQIIGYLGEKISYPMPRSLFQEISIQYGFTAHQADNGNLANMGMSGVGGFYGDSIIIKWAISPDWSLGVDFGKAQRNIISQIDADTFRQDRVDYSYIHAYFDRLIYTESPFSLRVFFGLGPIYGGYQYLQTSESLDQSKSLSRKGESFGYRAGFETVYYLNPVWNVGLQVSYFQGKISDMSNPVGTTDPNAEGMSLNGMHVSAFSGLSF